MIDDWQAQFRWCAGRRLVGYVGDGGDSATREAALGRPNNLGGLITSMRLELWGEDLMGF